MISDIMDDTASLGVIIRDIQYQVTCDLKDKEDKQLASLYKRSPICMISDVL
jgi:hypothetical protein